MMYNLVLHLELLGGSLCADSLVNFTRENPNDRNVFNDRQESIVAAALRLDDFTSYELLISRGFTLGPQEDLEELLRNISFPNERKPTLRSLHRQNVFMSPIRHLLELNSRSALSHNTDSEHLYVYYKEISRAFAEVNSDPLIKPLLQVIAMKSDLVIVFDFVNESVNQVDPTKGWGSKGVAYTKGSTIFVGAVGLLDEDQRLETVGTLVREICYFAMKIVYDNQCRPYSSFDEERKEKFFSIYISSYRRLKSHQEGILNSVFNCSSNKRYAGLIARVPQLIAAYKDRLEELQEVRCEFQELFKFYEENVLVDIVDKVEMLEQARRENFDYGTDEESFE